MFLFTHLCLAVSWGWGSVLTEPALRAATGSGCLWILLVMHEKKEKSSHGGTGIPHAS